MEYRVRQKRVHSLTLTHKLIFKNNDTPMYVNMHVISVDLLTNIYIN